MYCMIACSAEKTGAASLSDACLRILRHEGHAVARIDEVDELIFTLVVCRQCDEAACASACPSDALSREKATGAIVLESKRCSKCGACVSACPHGAMFSSRREDDEPFKCELCNGDPQCVTFCYAKALTYQRQSGEQQ